MCLFKWKKICLTGKPFKHVETAISFLNIRFHFMTDRAVSCSLSILKSMNKPPCSVPTPVPLSCAFIKTQTYLIPHALYNILSITVKLSYIVFPETEKRKHRKWETLNLIMWGMEFKRPALWGGLVCGNNKNKFYLKKKKSTLLQTIWQSNPSHIPLCLDTQYPQQIPRVAAVSFYPLLRLPFPPARL